MKFPPTIGWRDEEHCAALCAEHIPDAPPFLSYQLNGDDGQSIQLDLYDVVPDHTSQPFCIYKRVDGVLVTDRDFTQPASATPTNDARHERNR